MIQLTTIEGDSLKVLYQGRPITGVSVCNQRGMDKIEVQLLEDNTILAKLMMDVKTAQMLLRAFDCMKVLDETDSRAVPAVQQVPQNPGLEQNAAEPG